MNKPTTLRYITYGMISIILIIIIIIIFIVFTTLVFPQNKQDQAISQKTCIDTNDVSSIKYKGCYDAFSKNIFFEIQNINLIHDTTKVELSFFDYNPRNHEFNLPAFNTSSFYKIPATRNPLSAEITLKSIPNKYCETSKTISIEYCSAELANNKNISINLVTQANASNFTITNTSIVDKLPIDIVKIDQAWESICKSNWKCDPWQACIDNLQKRRCTDTNKCQIPTQVPQRVKSCEITCVENWQCQWSECTNGRSTPSCTDLSRCGTTTNKPSSISCVKKCTPDISCSKWSSCSTNYDFLTLSDGDYSLSGQQTRICTDKNACALPLIEINDCSLIIDIYTTSSIKCGKEYIGVYNQLDNKLLANIEKPLNKNQLNIDLSNDISFTYCDYCFDGILNGDEKQIDCDGSCPSCETRRVDIEYSKNIIEKILDNIFSFFK